MTFPLEIISHLVSRVPHHQGIQAGKGRLQPAQTVPAGACQGEGTEHCNYNRLNSDTDQFDLQTEYHVFYEYGNISGEH